MYTNEIGIQRISYVRVIWLQYRMINYCNVNLLWFDFFKFTAVPLSANMFELSASWVFATVLYNTSLKMGASHYHA